MYVDRSEHKIENIKQITLLAGEGLLPLHIYEECSKRGISCNIIGIKDCISVELFEQNKIEYDVLPIYSVSKILKKLHSFNTQYVTLAGRVKRINISKLLFDVKGIKLFYKIARKNMSDNFLLSNILHFLEDEGFHIIPTERIVSDLIVQKGNIVAGKIQISNSTIQEIDKGFEILTSIAQFDIGQALVIQSGLVLGVEAAEGTNELIKRCGKIQQQDCKPPILIKICKPNQDKRIDLPCIGSYTIEMLHQNNFMGVALEAGFSLILEPKLTISRASELNIFIYGI